MTVSSLVTFNNLSYSNPLERKTTTLCGDEKLLHRPNFILLKDDINEFINFISLSFKDSGVSRKHLKKEISYLTGQYVKDCCDITTDFNFRSKPYLNKKKHFSLRENIKTQLASSFDDYFSLERSDKSLSLSGACSGILHSFSSLSSTQIFIMMLMLLAIVNPASAVVGGVVRRSLSSCDGVFSDSVESESSRVACRQDLMHSFCDSVQSSVQLVQQRTAEGEASILSQRRPNGGFYFRSYQQDYIRTSDAKNTAASITVSDSCYSSIGSTSNSNSILGKLNSVKSSVSGIVLSCSGTSWCNVAWDWGKALSTEFVNNAMSSISSEKSSYLRNLETLNNLPIRTTPAPTRRPTTLRPSPSPTNRPTTLRPSPSPTNKPTTLRPSPSPTNKPTTLRPSPSPTNRPTTFRPSPSPTDQPTTPQSSSNTESQSSINTQTTPQSSSNTQSQSSSNTQTTPQSSLNAESPSSSNAQTTPQSSSNTESQSLTNSQTTPRLSLTTPAPLLTNNQTNITTSGNQVNNSLMGISPTSRAIVNYTGRSTTSIPTNLRSSVSPNVQFDESDVNAGSTQNASSQPIVTGPPKAVVDNSQAGSSYSWDNIWYVLIGVLGFFGLAAIAFYFKKQLNNNSNTDDRASVPDVFHNRAYNEPGDGFPHYAEIDENGVNSSAGSDSSHNANSYEVPAGAGDHLTGGASPNANNYEEPVAVSLDSSHNTNSYEEPVAAGSHHHYYAAVAGAADHLTGGATTHVVYDFASNQSNADDGFQLHNSFRRYSQASSSLGQRKRSLNGKYYDLAGSFSTTNSDGSTENGCVMPNSQSGSWYDQASPLWSTGVAPYDNEFDPAASTADYLAGTNCHEV